MGAQFNSNKVYPLSLLYHTWLFAVRQVPALYHCYDETFSHPYDGNFLAAISVIEIERVG